MLINMMGVEDDEAARVAAAASGAVDPKSRDTLTTLFGALLSNFAAANGPATPTFAATPTPAISAGGGAGLDTGGLAQDAA